MKRLFVSQVLLGLGSYALLLAAGNAMGESGFAVFAVFWSVVFSFGLGLFGPLELLLLRLAALRRPSVEHVEIPRLVTWYLWIGIVAGLGAAWFLLPDSAGAETSAFLAAAGFAYFQLLRTLAVQRGISAGRSNLPRYARQVGTDGSARLALGGLLLGLGVSDPAIWTWAVVASGLAGALAGRPSDRWDVSEFVGVTPAEANGLSDQPMRGSREALRDVLTLTAGTTVSVILANSLPALAVAMGASGAALATFSAASIVARLPVFFSGLGQALVVPRVAEAVDDHALLPRIERRVLLCLGGASAATAAFLGLAIGPIVTLAFSVSAQPSSTVVWLLAISTGALLFALIGQGLLVGQDWMGGVACVWVVALLAGAATLVVTDGPPTIRVASASAVSSAAACLTLLMAVGRLRRARAASIERP
jgi:hypothetical protein